MKDLVVRFLKWALSKFEPEPSLPEPPFKEILTAWPFPEEAPKPKTKPRVAKATTRPVKKAPAAKRTAAKKAK